MSDSQSAITVGLLGLFAGGSLGWTFKQATESKTTEPCMEHKTEPEPRIIENIRTIEVSAACEDELDAVISQIESREKEMFAISKQLSDLEEIAYGKALEWTDDLPDNWQEDIFTEAIRAVNEECYTEGALQEVDCSEPPCMAVFVGAPANIVFGCDAWTDKYGSSASMTSRMIECSSGEKMPMVILSPSNPNAGSTEEDPVERENRMKRMDYRWDSLTMDVPCPE